MITRAILSWGRGVYRVLLSLALWGEFVPSAAVGQLAITEVMSQASDAIQPRRPDFWELTNFGSKRIDLTPYRWVDSAGFEAADPRFFQGRSIGAGESILLVRSNVVTTLSPAQVYEWWGPGNLSLPLQVFFYPGPGFSQDYDAVQLWKVTASSTNLVDRVEFFAAQAGSTFTYNSDTGEFDSLSRVGIGGAFRAAAGLDIGSPGRTTGPVPLKILAAPRSGEVDAGSAVTFTVAVQGLPKPRFQWMRNQVPIPGATEAAYTITQAPPAAAGLYTVQIDNDLEKLETVPAELTVNTVLSCARVVQPPADLELTPGQDARFSVQARGYPLPTYQWLFNGVPILGATEPTFTFPSVTPTLSGILSVQVANFLCSTTVSARLKVIPPPELRVTEVMAAASTNTPFHSHGDWWELTNQGTNTVPLHGYRFDDTPGVLAGAIVITNDLSIAAGESIIFISDQLPQDFVNWWGPENLPAGLQIVSYPGNSFDSLGDALFLWNATALTREDVITSVSFVNDTRGVSLWFDPLVAEFGELSIEGERGAFRAAQGDDVGSPGWTSNPPPREIPPRILTFQQARDAFTLAWKTQPGRSYEVQYADAVNPSEWSTLEVLVAEQGTLTTIDLYDQAPQRFYRVVLVPIP